MSTISNMNEAIIDECVKRTREILESDWDEIESMRDQNEGRIKVMAAYLISFRGNEQAVKTTVTFGRKVTESRESIINPNQIPLDLEGNGEPPGTRDEAAQAERPAQGRKRASKASQEP